MYKITIFFNNYLHPYSFYSIFELCEILYASNILDILNSRSFAIRRHAAKEE